jgi:small-conductance mechanosensitive channel
MSKILQSILKPKAITSIILIILIMGTLFYFSSTPYYADFKEVLTSPPFILEIGKNKITLYMVLKSLIIMVVFFWFAGLISDFGSSRIENLKHLKGANKALTIKLYRIVVYAIGFLIGIEILGIDLTSFAIFSGAIGIGLGFGLQKVTSNFISGLILLFEKSLETNDLIELNDGTFGYVRRMGARYILIEGTNGKKIMVPNESFITNQVINWTYRNRKARVDINVSISYDDDAEKALQILHDAALENDKCLKTPAPTAFVKEFADNAIKLSLNFWVNDVTEGRAAPQSDVMLKILHKFKEHGIHIPNSKNEIRVVNVDSRQPS